MKTLQTVIDGRLEQLNKYKADQAAKGKAIAEFSEAVKMGCIEGMTIDPEVLKVFKEYAETEAAIELGQTGFYKNAKLKKDAILKEKKKLWEQLSATQTAPMTADDVKVAQVLAEAIILRMAKAKDNYNIQIKDALRDILMYRLIKNVEDKPELQPEGYHDFLDHLLAEPEKKKSVKLPPFKPEAGWTLDQLEKECVKATGKSDWGVIGKALEFYSLKPGAGGKLVAC
jgi:hypothetical protein